MSIKKTSDTQATQELVIQVIERGVVEIIEKDHLLEALRGGKKLRVKFGIDPTAPDIHLGHTIPLWKLRHFQELGHTAVIIIGDYTASIGDPSGKDTTRHSLSLKEIKNNSALYKNQILKILKKDQTELHFQSEWFNKFRLKDILELTSRLSVSYLLSHETFRKRLENERPFMAHEMLYPLLQGYDSVMVKADVEVGASEQKFNILTGRVLQKQAGMEPQDVVLTPYLIGTDGAQKMSKSLGNYIGLSEEPNSMYGKLMSIPDALVRDYFTYLTELSKEEIQNLVEGGNPRATKALLAHIITEFYWGKKDADEAAEEFDRVFAQHQIPSDIPAITISKKEINIMDFLVALNLVPSKSEAKRMVEQRAVFINDEIIEDWRQTITPSDGSVVRVGRRKFARVRIK
ncbi:MAG: tyrosine--tRNA ligase [Candidatus Spechtbacteria bacterium]|nr:tyrosine--tRNA ligase [Candidatus Spechtbacteria bacterium]